mgnify:CR=1 FL=1
MSDVGSNEVYILQFYCAISQLAILPLLYLILPCKINSQLKVSLVTLCGFRPLSPPMSPLSCLDKTATISHSYQRKWKHLNLSCVTNDTWHLPVATTAPSPRAPRAPMTARSLWSLRGPGTLARGEAMVSPRGPVVTEHRVLSPMTGTSTSPWPHLTARTRRSLGPRHVVNMLS